MCTFFPGGQNGGLGASSGKLCQFCSGGIESFLRLRGAGGGILARLRVIDPLFFLWTHKFQLKLTITRPLGRAYIHNGVKISHAKSLKMSHFCPPNYQNIELRVLN